MRDDEIPSEPQSPAASQARGWAWGRAHSKGVIIGGGLGAVAGLVVILVVGSDASVCGSLLGQFAQSADGVVAAQCAGYTAGNILGWIALVGGCGATVVGWLTYIESPQPKARSRLTGAGASERGAGSESRLQPPIPLSPTPPGSTQTLRETGRVPLRWQGQELGQKVASSEHLTYAADAAKASTAPTPGGRETRPQIAATFGMSPPLEEAPRPAVSSADEVEPLHTVIRRVLRRIGNMDSGDGSR